MLGIISVVFFLLALALLFLATGSSVARAVQLIAAGLFLIVLGALLERIPWW